MRCDDTQRSAAVPVLRNGRWCAQVILGGAPHARGGLFFQPTIITGVDERMLVTGARRQTSPMRTTTTTAGAACSLRPVVSRTTSRLRARQEETFGPLAPLYRFETDEEVLRQARRAAAVDHDVGHLPMRGRAHDDDEQPRARP
jgi:acyl-CoA reductase-like NAD-dependent aldehyde dehydrogenase